MSKGVKDTKYSMRQPHTLRVMVCAFWAGNLRRANFRLDHHRQYAKAASVEERGGLMSAKVVRTSRLNHCSTVSLSSHMPTRYCN